MSELSEEVIQEVLSSAYSREQAHGREPVYFRTPLDEILSREAGETSDEAAIRLEARLEMLEWFFGDGPHPGHVMRRVFAMAKSIKSGLILNMSLEEMGLMLGETKAAGSWRIKKLINTREPESRALRIDVRIPFGFWLRFNFLIAFLAVGPSPPSKFWIRNAGDEFGPVRFRVTAFQPFDLSLDVLQNLGCARCQTKLMVLLFKLKIHARPKAPVPVRLVHRPKCDA